MCEDELRFSVFETAFPALDDGGLDINLLRIRVIWYLTLVMAERTALTMTTSVSCFCRTDSFWGDVCVVMANERG